MKFTGFYTRRCIVTGALATQWSGYVRMTAFGDADPPDDLVQLSVIAGFVDDQAMREAGTGEAGCHGDWKPGHGLMALVHDGPVQRLPVPVERAVT